MVCVLDEDDKNTEQISEQISRLLFASFDENVRFLPLQFLGSKVTIDSGDRVLYEYFRNTLEMRHVPVIEPRSPGSIGVTFICSSQGP